MIQVKVIEEFNLGKFDELKNIRRANLDKNEKGHLYVNDTFECTEEMAEYLTTKNANKRAYVKVIEVVPEEVKKVEKPKRKSRRVL